jgi:predicted ATP-dependent serine protease
MFITNVNIQNTKHEVMPFSGVWRDCFGNPQMSGSWIIYGTSGSGKTSFALQLAKYLTRFRRVLYWSIEQGNTPSFQKSWKREGMDECRTDIIMADEDETFKSVEKSMNQRYGRGVLIIDSLTPLRAQQFSIKNYEAFRKRMKGKLLIFISHEKHGIPDTKVGDYILKLSDLKMRVEGFKVSTITRSGKGLRDYVVWEEGNDIYLTKS